jgi:hypothetical protein
MGPSAPGRAAVHFDFVYKAATLLVTTALGLGLVLTVSAVPATAVTHPPASVPGQALCSLSATLTFSPPLTNAGGGSNPTTFLGHLKGCTVSDSSVAAGRGTATGSFASSLPPVSCPGQSAADDSIALSVAWKGNYYNDSSPPFSVGPSSLSTTGEGFTTGGTTIGIDFPGPGGTAVTSGSFARSSPGGWSAAMASPVTSAAFDSKCASRAGVKTLKLTGTMAIGASYGFNGPRGMATDGTDVWVANYFNSGDSVTEFDASTGAAVRTIPGFSNPWAIAYGDSHVFVISPFASAVTEIDAATGATIATLSGGSYGFDGMENEVSDGSHIWLMNDGDNTVTEIDASTGTWIQTLSDPSYGFDVPGGAVFDGSHVWITDPGSNSVAEIDESTGLLVHEYSGSPFGLHNPSGVAFDGSNVWVTNEGNNSVTEIAAGTGDWIQTISAKSYGFNEPTAVVSDGAHVWVVNPSGNSVTELDAATGALLQNVTTTCNGYTNLPLTALADSTHVWVASQNSAFHGSDAVIEYDASTGGLIQTLQG